MKNSGLFCNLFIENLRRDIELDDAAKGRLDTITQQWKSRSTENVDEHWEKFLIKVIAYLGFATKENSISPNVYPLYEDWNFEKCISILYFVPPGSNIDNISVGNFYPAKLLSNAEAHNLKWGILTNGVVWRLFSLNSSRPFEDYVELNLENTLIDSDEIEYGIFEKFFHKDAFIPININNDGKWPKILLCEAP